jgi:hypothetical protein
MEIWLLGILEDRIFQALKALDQGDREETKHRILNVDAGVKALIDDPRYAPLFKYVLGDLVGIRGRLLQALDDLDRGDLNRAGAFLVDAHGVLVEIFERIVFGEEEEEEEEVEVE